MDLPLLATDDANFLALGGVAVRAIKVLVLMLGKDGGGRQESGEGYGRKQTCHS